MNSTHQITESAVVTPFHSLPAEEPHWFALQTRARHEAKVASQLGNMGFTFFLPLIAETHQWSDRRKVVHTPLFSGYVFIRLASRIGCRLGVPQMFGIVGLVAINGFAAPIPDCQIEAVRALLATEAACTPYPFLKVGRRVRILGGSLGGVEGILMGKNADRSLVVSIELIQRSVAVRIDGYAVEAV